MITYESEGRLVFLKGMDFKLTLCPDSPGSPGTPWSPDEPEFPCIDHTSKMKESQKVSGYQRKQSCESRLTPRPRFPLEPLNPFGPCRPSLPWRHKNMLRHFGLQTSSCSCFGCNVALKFQCLENGRTHWDTRITRKTRIPLCRERTKQNHINQESEKEEDRGASELQQMCGCRP